MRRMVLTVTVLCALSGVASIAQQPPAPAAQDARPRFETASIKPSTDPLIGALGGPGRPAYVNTPLEVFITLAYSVPADRVVSLPDWAKQEKYDITATHNPQIVTLGPQQRAMWQRLLEERFSLRTHRETRDMPVYELVRVRADGFGPQLRPPVPECGPGGTGDRALCGTRFNMGIIDSKYVEWRVVMSRLQSTVGRTTVIDKTGLLGRRFEVKLEWWPDPGVTGSPEAAATATAAAATPGERVDIFTALQEQLGLRLQPARAPLEVLVIDSVERPTPD
jgi:bla regulator protein blaR1